jgi:threonine dehydrogenase-like Zn-dependent dehydrogenase
VRRPDPVPCPQCAADEWDMCTNGRYTEHGIKGLDGFLRDRFRLPPDAAIKVDRSLGKHAVLIEPISVVAKAWDHIERIGSRSRWEPKKALVTGAGPLGLFGTLLGIQRGFEMHVLDVVTDGPKPELAKDLGATYHAGDLEDAGGDFDIVLECTGVGPLVFHAIDHLAAGGIMCLTGINPAGRESSLNVDDLNKEMVLNNEVVFGSVNAGRRHYEAAAEALPKADPAWLDRLVTRWESLEDWQAALERRDGDVKTVIRVSDELESA